MTPDSGTTPSSAWRSRPVAVTILIVAFTVPILFVHLTAPEPQTRRIHIEHFRYGMSPEVIHVNRGDTLILTFSSHDSAHSFFLQEYDLDVKITSNAEKVEVARPSDPEGDTESMREVVPTWG